MEIGAPVIASTSFHLQHQESKVFLYTALDQQYNQRNCGNCPIQGQLEISGDLDKSSRTKWRVVSGVFYVNSEKDKNTQKEEL